MNTITRKTRACTIDTLDEELKTAIREYGTKFGLADIESDVLMCCETITVHPKKGIFGGITTTLSAVYVTPKWLVWADSTGQKDVVVGTAPLHQIRVRADRATAQYAIGPDQGINITGHYTDPAQTGTTFIVLEPRADGQKFRQILSNALRIASGEF